MIMAKKLNYNKANAKQLTTKTSVTFKILLEEELDKKHDFTVLKNKGNIKSFQDFLYKLIGKSWEDVEKLYRRKDYKNEKHNGEQIIHFGEDGKSFRLHGIKRDNKYFVLLKIDPNHDDFSKKK